MRKPTTHFVDSSGSIYAGDDTDMSFLSNVRVGDTIACFDTKIHNVKRYVSRADIDAYQLDCGGGSDPKCISEMIERENIDGPVVIYSDLIFYSKPPVGKNITIMATNSYDTRALVKLREMGHTVKVLDEYLEARARRARFIDYAACFAMIVILIAAMVFMPSIRAGTGVVLGINIVTLGVIVYHDCRRYFQRISA